MEKSLKRNDIIYHYHYMHYLVPLEYINKLIDFITNINNNYIISITC